LPQKLEDKLLRRLEAALSKSEYSQGKKLKVVTKVNPDILEGSLWKLASEPSTSAFQARFHG